LEIRNSGKFTASGFFMKLEYHACLYGMILYTHFFHTYTQ